MKRFYVLTIITVVLASITQLGSQAMVYYRDMSYTPVKSVYKCKFRKQTCTVFKIGYMQRNRAYYDAQCTGSSFEQNTNAKAAETDVRRKRFSYCTLESSYMN